MVVTRLLPTGAKVAFGGFFLDAVTSTKRAKNFRYRECWRVGDQAYLNGTALHRPPEARVPGRKGRPKTRGERLPTPAELIEDPTTFRASRITAAFGGTPRRLRVQVVLVLVLVLVLVRDVTGERRNEVLLATGGGGSASFADRRLRPLVGH